MMILALETTAKAASCAVLQEGMPLATAWQATGLTHSRTLMPMVEDMLKNSELTLADMDAIAVAAGPGSFTGLRIGIAAVKGLAWAADKPCVGVSTLEAMAWPLAHMTGTIVCAMDARRQQIYNAIFAAEADGAGNCLPGRTGPPAAPKRCRCSYGGGATGAGGTDVRSGVGSGVSPPEPGGAGASGKTESGMMVTFSMETADMILQHPGTEMSRGAFACCWLYGNLILLEILYLIL